MPSFDRHRGADRPPSSGLGNRYARASDALVQLREENAVAAGGFPKPNSPFMVGETVMAKATDWEKYYTGRVSTNHNGSRSSTVTFDDGDVVVCEWAFMKALGDGDE